MSDTIGDLLKDQERILIAAWVLPNEGTLTETQRRQAMDNFTLYLRRHGLTPTHVAHQLGRPHPTKIGALMKGDVPSVADEDIRRLNMWVEQHARQQIATVTDTFVSTKVAKDMLTVARVVRENQTMGLVLGPTGIGKTRCALAVHEKYVGSIYIRIITGYHHCKGLTHALAGPLGTRGSYASARDGQYQSQLERVIDTLRGSDRFLLIDEAHALRTPTLELLRDIHDSSGVPILLIATRDLHDRIVENADPDHGQLYSRFDVVHHLTQGHDVYSGGRALYTLADIKALYNEPPVRLSSDGVCYLQDVANMLGYGSLRRCKMLLQNAVRRARKRQGLEDHTKVTVTAADLEWVEHRLRQEVGEQQTMKDRRRKAAGTARG